jgi:hypothetical protein
VLLSVTGVTQHSTRRKRVVVKKRRVLNSQYESEGFDCEQTRAFYDSNVNVSKALNLVKWRLLILGSLSEKRTFEMGGSYGIL